jgi:hypothetical protein
MQYLWIDRYCIGQSDAEQKHRMINNMDSIYQGAEVTIIAAAGSGPDHGLPGVSTSKRLQRQIFKTGKYSVTATHNPKVEILSSKWSTRGWTYQEMLLSRRRLVFTDSQVYFQCHEAYHYEGIPSISRFNPVFPLNGVGNDVNEIYTRLNEYYSRHLSVEGDILNAFHGIFNAFLQQELLPSARTHNFWGIPFFLDRHEDRQFGFTLGLIWSINADATSTPQKRAGEWPSWSWAATKFGLLDMGSMVRYRSFTRLQLWRPSRHSFTVTAITKRSGEEMDLKIYAARLEDYTQFYPWLNITGWTMMGRLRPNGQGDLQFFEDHMALDQHVRLDYTWRHENTEQDFDRKIKEEEFCALYLENFGILGLGEFLLIEEQEPGVFRRIGHLSAVSLWAFPHEAEISALHTSQPCISEFVNPLKDRWLYRALRLV